MWSELLTKQPMDIWWLQFEAIWNLPPQWSSWRSSHSDEGWKSEGEAVRPASCLPLTSLRWACPCSSFKFFLLASGIGQGWVCDPSQASVSRSGGVARTAWSTDCFLFLTKSSPASESYTSFHPPVSQPPKLSWPEEVRRIHGSLTLVTSTFSDY